MPKVSIKSRIRAAKTKSQLSNILEDFLDEHPYSYELLDEIYRDLKHDREYGTRYITFKDAKRRALRCL